MNGVAESSSGHPRSDSCRNTRGRHAAPDLTGAALRPSVACAPQADWNMVKLGWDAHVLGKAQAHIEAKKLDPKTLLEFRLFPDMLHMTRQVQIASDTAKGVVARLAGIEIPAYEDNEQSVADLQARLAKTVAFVQSVSSAQIDGTEDKDIVVKRGDKETHYKGMQFLLGHALPNIYFHSSMTYAILRHCGVEIGKRDYLGNP